MMTVGDSGLVGKGGGECSPGTNDVSHLARRVPLFTGVLRAWEPDAWQATENEIIPRPALSSLLHIPTPLQHNTKLTIIRNVERKLTSDINVNLTDDQIVDIANIKDDDLPEGLKALAPFLNALKKGSEDRAAKKTIPVRQATDFKRTTLVTQCLEIEYEEEDEDYIFELKEEHLHHNNDLSTHFSEVVKAMKKSKYVSTRNDESFSQ